MKEVLGEKTKKGFPAMWEAGGGYSNTGEAIIIASPTGEKKTPVYVRRRGSLANSVHALFIVQQGDVVVEADHHRRDFNIKVYRIQKFLEKDQEIYAVLEQITEFSQGEWSKPLPPELEDAVQAAMEKATCYHCRKPHYAIIPEIN
jgi:hypothetical protein